jgi:CRP-like cAMP-binding protein
MVSNEELRKIILFSYLTEEMLEKISPLVETIQREDRETIFRQGDIADKFFMLKRGKVLLEQKITEKITVSVGSIKPGYSFGWSAMLDGGYYTSAAVCAEYSEIFFVRAPQIKNILEKDHSLGYVFTQRLLRVMKNRLDHRTDQFMRVIKHHPDIQSLFEN